MGVFNSVSSSTALLSTQLYAPYGSSRFTAGSPTNYTSKGYTGQYNDFVSGLDYYNARYYDPVSGVFLSADSVEGNDSGMNPYAYAGGNPATYNDPSGERYAECLQSQCGGEGNVGTIQGESTGADSGTGTSIGGGDDNNGGGGSLLQKIVSGVGGVMAFVRGLLWGTPSHQNTSFHTVTLGQDNGETKDIQPPKGVNSIRPSLYMVNPGDGGSGKKPPKKPTASPPSGDGNGFGKLSGNEYHVSEQGIRTIESHLSRPEFIDSYTGRIALEEPENATMISRLMNALSQGRTISGADASFYLHELYENTLMEDGMGSLEAHEAAIERYEVSPFSIYHPDAILANPSAFGLPYFEFWGLSP